MGKEEEEEPKSRKDRKLALSCATHSHTFHCRPHSEFAGLLLSVTATSFEVLVLYFDDSHSHSTIFRMENLLFKFKGSIL
jgi:hypothetical protein